MEQAIFVRNITERQHHRRQRRIRNRVAYRNVVLRHGFERFGDQSGHVGIEVREQFKSQKVPHINQPDNLLRQ
jgi:hypothetical protein